MDNILLIDAMNQIHRSGAITFGAPKPHFLSIDIQNDNKCNCGLVWDFDNASCFADQYLTIYNFFRNIRPLIEKFSPNKCFLVLEGHPQFRYDIFKDYKANRLIKTADKKDKRDKLFAASKQIVKLCSYLPITLARAADYEADDVIATLVEDLKEENITIISNDSDYLQLLQKGYDNIKIYNPIKKTFMEESDYPYIAWKCLNGDKSDNIPALVKPKQAIDLSTNPEKFKAFMAIEENRANFKVNQSLIEFRMVPMEEVSLIDGETNFISLWTEFNKMKFESISNTNSWLKFTETFNCIKY